MDSHFNGYKIKYDMLDKYMLPICRSQIVTSINIFINLDDLFHMLHNPLINSEFQICGRDAPRQLISNIFNLIGHYRYWAIKNHYTVKVFAIYTTTIRSFKNNIYIPEYRKHFKMINAQENASCFFVNSAIQSAMPLIPILSKFIPDVYVIDSKYLEPSMIPLYIYNNEYEASWNILVSRDPYDLQYAYRNKWSLVAPKGENSMVVNQKGIWNYVNFKERVYEEKENLTYPYELYVLAKAIVGDKYRSIPRLRRVGWKTLFNFLNQIMEENPSASDTTLKIKLIEKIKGKSLLTNEDFNRNLNAINIDLQENNMIELDKVLIRDQIIDVPDYENLQEFVRENLSDYPLNLQFLCNTISSKTSTPFD